MKIPIIGLDAELRGFTTDRSRTRPARFHFVALGGEVNLPVQKKGGVLRGAASAAAGVFSGPEENADIPMEPRPIFFQMGGAGEWDPAEQALHNLELGIRGFELMAYSGIASHAGVVLQGGVLDASGSLKARAGGGAEVTSTITFTNLVIAEKEDTIGRALRLPATLHGIVFLLRDSDGKISIPVDFIIEQDEVSAHEVTLVATTALSSAIYDALRGSPRRVVSSAADLVEWTGVFSLPGAKQLAGLLEPVEDVEVGRKEAVVEFAAGDAALRSAEKEKLLPISEALLYDKDLLLRLRSTVRSADSAYTERLLNPDRDDVAKIKHRLLENKKASELAYAENSALAKVAHATGQDQEALKYREQLHKANRDLGLTEEVLDRIGKYLAPGTDPIAFRMRRRLSLDLAELRIATVRNFLLEAGVQDIDQRLVVLPAHVARHGTNPAGTVTASLLRLQVSR